MTLKRFLIASVPTTIVLAIGLWYINQPDVVASSSPLMRWSGLIVVTVLVGTAQGAIEGVLAKRRSRGTPSATT